jgi:limonene-1,2-epoxide hydrolase
MSAATIRRFYAAFERLDGQAMQACYADNAHFQDEAFSLKGPREIGGMWRMLCETTRAKGMAHWKLEVSDITDRSAHWEAHYLFTATGRLVHNRIDARFEFDGDGRILRHVDRFDFAAWARQALGAPGWLLGWTPWLRSQVKQRAATQLKRYLERQPA